MAKNPNLKCDICGRTSKDLPVIPTPQGNFCVECFQRLTDEMQAEEPKDQETKPLPKLPPTPTPKEIKEFLDQYVIGQEATKKVLSVAVHNHYRRLEATERDEEKIVREGLKRAVVPAGYMGKMMDVEIEKSNILLVGPTGSGKTLLAKTLAKMLGVPFAIGDATVLTQAGYVGEDVENLVRYLLQNADGNVELAQRGIIYVDEIDKIASKTDNVSITRDVGGEGVQQSLLKIVEGTICRIPPKGGRKHPDQDYIEVDTSNILFICGGAFVGLDKIIKARSDKGAIGFGSEHDAKRELTMADARPEDFVKYGLIPEFTGRLPIVTVMSELTEDDLVRILTEPKNSLVKQYTKLLKMDDVDLEFEPEALKALAALAVERKTGARGLRAEMEKLMLDIMYDAPSKKQHQKIVVTASMVAKKCV